MGCPCKDDIGKLVEVPAKTKEMVYRMRNPDMQAAIAQAKEEDIKDMKKYIPTIPVASGGKGEN